MKVNILITSASRKVNWVKAFKNALNQEGGGKIIAVDTDPLSPALFHSDLSYIVPRSTEPTFIHTILSLCKTHQVTLLIPSRDEELKIFAENKEEFNKIGTKVMVSDPNVIEICLDKLKFVRFCENNNIPIPKTYSPTQIKDLKQYFPLFIRDRFGKASKKAYKVENQQHLDFILTQISEPIIQEYVHAPEYTIDLFADFDGNIISVVPRERIYVYGGESFKGRTYRNESLIESTIELATKLKLIGHNTIQCFFENDVTKFIEVNPRYGGGMNLGIAAGANTPRYLIKLLKGVEIENRIGQFKDGLIMLRYTQDVIIEEKDLNRVIEFGKAIKAILFDLDDTLYDEMQFVKGGFKAVSSYISKNNNTDQNTVYPLLLEALEKHGRGHTFDIALKKLGLYSEKSIPKLVDVYRTHKPNLSLYPEVRAVFSALRKQGYKLGLLTDGNVEVQRNKVEALKIKDFFDCMIFSDEYGIEKQKPSPFPYQKAMAELKVSARETIYIGDNPYKDFITAKKLGMCTMRLLRGHYKDVSLQEEYEAVYQIKNLSELGDTITHMP